MKTFIRKYSILLAVLFLTSALAEGNRQVFINQSRISDEDVYALETYYQVQIPDGYFWYDPISGLVGVEGGPSVGQIYPDLPLGGSLRADASQGNTSVFVNGRELHLLEVIDLQRLLGVVYPGYYWMDAQGNVGAVGGGFLFNLYTVSSSSDPLRADGRSIFGHSLTGSVIGDGQTVGFIDGGLGITCGPDGGCF